MPLQATSGAASYDAFGGGVAVVPNYIEDVFQTWLYTGNGSTQTINNGIDLAGKGGLVWTKSRSLADPAFIYDTARGINNFLVPSSTQAAVPTSRALTSFNNNGFTLGDNDFSNDNIGETSVSWTFREQPKFFDVVTYTGDGTTPRSIAHNLGSTAACVMVKRTDTTGNWKVLFTGLTRLCLNSAEAEMGTLTVQGGYIDNANATTFTLVSNAGSVAEVNASGGTYVAYVFASNAGGFGLTGTDNVISCGSFTTDANGTIPATTLGYEPQWVMFKASSTTGSWTINDTMRGQPTPVSSNGSAPDATLYANNANAESQADNLFPTSTGFRGVFAAVVPSTTYIYIAIRRGPMRTPTTGTQVYATDTAGGTLPNPPLYNSGWPVDLGWYRGNMPNAASNDWYDRLRGQTQTLFTNNTSQEEPFGGGNYSFDSNTGWSTQNFVQSNSRAWMFRRAPGFFDVVCYTGTGSARTVAHSLGVAPELMIVKQRTVGGEMWCVYVSSLGPSNSLWLNEALSVRAFGSSYWNSTAPTASVFTVGPSSQAVNASGTNYVAYLFASCPGVSKVFNFTGNGSSQTINCGFTGGARFVMVKRTDSTGNWMVVDTARGLVSAGDPTLYLNSTAAEVTGVDWIDPDSSGFIVNQEGTMNANVNGATYIGIAIA